MVPLATIRAWVRAFWQTRRPLPLLCAAFLIWNSVPLWASSPLAINSITITGTNISSVACTSTAYLSCYKLTMSSIDAFGLTSGNGLRSIINPNAANPTSTLWISDINVSFQIGTSLNGQTGNVGLFQVAGFTHTYLAAKYCKTGCTTNAAFATVPGANTNLYTGVSEGPTGGPASSYPMSIGTLITAGNGASFAGFGTPGIQGDTYQLDVRITSIGNGGSGKTGDALITIDVQQAATAIMTNVSYDSAFGTVTGLPFSAAQPVTANPFPGTVNYNTGYTVTPQFTQFSSTTGTLAGYVSTDFSPALAASTLSICDASANTTAAVCTPLSKSAASPTTISSGLTSNTAFSHYQGLIVAEGPGYPGNTTTGNVNATVTFVFSVP